MSCVEECIIILFQDWYDERDNDKVSTKGLDSVQEELAWYSLWVSSYGIECNAKGAREIDDVVEQILFCTKRSESIHSCETAQIYLQLEVRRHSVDCDSYFLNLGYEWICFLPSVIRNEFTMGVARITILRPTFLMSKNPIKKIGSITTKGMASPKANKYGVAIRTLTFLFTFCGSITIL